MDGPTAANIAREAAETQGTYFTSLSSEMCWDAVALCQGREPGRHIDENATLVRNDGDLSYIPEGATIGFFDGGVLVHAMISLGQGLAAGNKNINRFFALDNSGFDEGAIPALYKELSGLTASLVIRCNDCIFYHVDRSVTVGATKEQILEAMNIGTIGQKSVDKFTECIHVQQNRADDSHLVDTEYACIEHWLFGDGQTQAAGIEKSVANDQPEKQAPAAVFENISNLAVVGQARRIRARREPLNNFSHSFLTEASYVLFQASEL